MPRRDGVKGGVTEGRTLAFASGLLKKAARRGLQVLLIDNSFWNEKMLFLHFFDEFFTIQFGTIKNQFVFTTVFLQFNMEQMQETQNTR